MTDQITQKFIDLLGPVTDDRLTFGNYHHEGIHGMDSVTELTEQQKQQAEQLLKDHFRFKQVKWIDYVGGAGEPGKAVVAQTHKLADNDILYEGKTAYVYQILFSPKMYDPKTIHEPVKDGCILTPLVYNPATFIPKRKIVIEYSPEYTNEILTDEDMKQHLRGKLEKVLANPGEYQAEGFRACMLRFAAK